MKIVHHWRTSRSLVPLLQWTLAVAWAATFTSSVSAQNPSGTRDEKLEPVVVTSTRTAERAVDVLADHVVIDAAAIERSGARSIIDLLQRQRGIEVNRNGGPGTSSDVFIRGAESKQSIVLIDGVRFVSGTTGAPNWQGIPLSQVERIEIVYGPLSSLYGANAMGGVIQIFTKDGGGKPRVSGSAEVGTYDSRAVTADVSGSAGEQQRLRYSFGVAREQAGGVSATRPTVGPDFNPDSDSYQRRSARARFSYDIAPGHQLSANVLKSRLDADFDSGSTAFDARNLFDQDLYSISTANRLLDNWTSTVQLSRAFDRQRSLTSGDTSTLNTRLDGVSWQHDVTVGRDLLQMILERKEEHVNTNLLGSRRRDTNSLVAAYQLRRNPHLATLSVRHDWADLYGEKTTGNVGYGYRITETLRASASIGTSFFAPTFNDLYRRTTGNLAIQPEQGKNAEIGVQYDDGSRQLNASYYRNRITNLINNSSRTSPVTNTKEAMLEGVTVGAGWKLAALTLRTSLDFQDPRDEQTGQQLRRRARRHGTFGVDYVSGPFKATADTVFSDSRFSDTLNTQRLGGYGLLHLSTSYDVTRDWTLFARWNNVFDKDYELAQGYRTEGSSLFVGVRYGMQ